MLRSASASGYELKLVRGSKDTREECTMTEAVDDSVKLVYFRVDRMVRMMTKQQPSVGKKQDFKRVLAIRNERTELQSVPEKSEYKEEIKADDYDGLSRLLKMHSTGKIHKRVAIGEQSETSKCWARDKFKTIGTEGKKDILKKLAIRTVSELRIHSGGGTGMQTSCGEGETKNHKDLLPGMEG